MTFSRFFARFCRSLTSWSAGKMTRFGVCLMNMCRITGIGRQGRPGGEAGGEEGDGDHGISGDESEIQHR